MIIFEWFKLWLHGKKIISIFINFKWIKYDLLIRNARFCGLFTFFAFWHQINFIAFPPPSPSVNDILFLKIYFHKKRQNFTLKLPSSHSDSLSIKWRISLLRKYLLLVSVISFLLIVNCKLCQEFPLFIFLLSLDFCASQHKNRLRQFTWMLCDFYRTSEWPKNPWLFFIILFFLPKTFKDYKINNSERLPCLGGENRSPS